MPLLFLDEVLLVVDTYFKTRQLGNRYLKQLYIEELVLPLYNSSTPTCRLKWH